MTNLKLKANNESEIEELVAWFKERFPACNDDDLDKFIKAVSN